MTIVDSHLHIDLNGLTPTALINYLDKNKFDYCWLLTWEEINPGPWDYQHISIENTYEAYQKYPSRIIPFFAPDPHRQDAPILLEKWYKKGIRGCGELKATFNWDSNEIKSILSTAETLGIPLVFHMQGRDRRILPSSSIVQRRLFKISHLLLSKQQSYEFPGYMLDFQTLETSLMKFPRLNFVAHGPMFWSHISTTKADYKKLYPNGDIIGEGIIWHLLRKYPNLFVDISARSALNALMRNPTTARKFLDEFAGKILYGSDNFFNNQKEFINSLGLGKDVYRKIYGDNACRLISI